LAGYVAALSSSRATARESAEVGGDSQRQSGGCQTILLDKIQIGDG